MLVDMLKSGELERFIITVLVFGTLAFLFVTSRPVDDRLLDVALVVLGFYFGQVAAKFSNGKP